MSFCTHAIPKVTFSKTKLLDLAQVFSRSVVSNSLRPHEPQHARPPCPSPTPGVYPNSYPLSQWCHLTISSSVIPFSSCPQSFPKSGSFPISQIFASGGQRIGATASASVLPMSIQGWFPEYSWYMNLVIFNQGLVGSHAVLRTLKSLLQYHSSKVSILWCSVFFRVYLSHPYMTTGKTMVLIMQIFVNKKWTWIASAT